eukprot:gene6922-7140_t
MPSSEEQQQALQLRRAVVDELRKRREDIEPFLPGIADDFDEYLATMSQPGVWGVEDFNGTATTAGQTSLAAVPHADVHP